MLRDDINPIGYTKDSDGDHHGANVVTLDRDEGNASEDIKSQLIGTPSSRKRRSEEVSAVAMKFNKKLDRDEQLYEKQMQAADKVVELCAKASAYLDILIANSVTSNIVLLSSEEQN